MPKIRIVRKQDVNSTDLYVEVDGIIRKWFPNNEEGLKSAEEYVHFLKNPPPDEILYEEEVPD